MAMNVNRQELDEFCPQLFRALDNLRLLPIGLSWKRDKSGKPQRVAPTELEKYPRLLFGSIQRYNDVEVGFREWESRVLRDVETPSRREAHYPALETLRQWMVDHKNVFTVKANTQHLRTSLYARLFQYLYPRRVVASAYCEKHKGQTEHLEKFSKFVDAKGGEEKKTAEFELARLLETELPQSIAETVQKVSEVFKDDWATIVSDARVNLVANAAYYRSALAGKEPLPVPEEPVETEPEELDQIPEEK